MSFDCSIQSFKVIIDTYVCITILNLVFQLFLCLVFFPFVCVCVVWRFPFILSLCSILFGFCESFSSPFHYFNILFYIFMIIFMLFLCVSLLSYIVFFSF